jgi:hypothetical protein
MGESSVKTRGHLFPKVTEVMTYIERCFRQSIGVIWYECNNETLILLRHSVTETCFKIYIFSGNLIVNIIQWRMEYFAYITRCLRTGFVLLIFVRHPQGYEC